MRFDRAFLSATITKREPDGTGTGLYITAYTSVNTIVFSPMPNANVATIASENQRCARIVRSANRKSCPMPHSTDQPCEKFHCRALRQVRSKKNGRLR